jgi:hypothetical protein
VASATHGSGMMEKVTSPRDLLAIVGEALYGPRWQSDVARDLKVDDRTVRRWLAGDTDPAPGVWRDLLAIVEARRTALAEARTQLAAFVRAIKPDRA